MNFQSVTPTHVNVLEGFKLARSKRVRNELYNDPGRPQVPVCAATYGYRETILQNYIIHQLAADVLFKKTPFVRLLFLSRAPPRAF